MLPGYPKSQREPQWGGSSHRQASSMAGKRLKPSNIYALLVNRYSAGGVIGGDRYKPLHGMFHQQIKKGVKVKTAMVQTQMHKEWTVDMIGVWMCHYVNFDYQQQWTSSKCLQTLLRKSHSQDSQMFESKKATVLNFLSVVAIIFFLCMKINQFHFLRFHVFKYFHQLYFILKLINWSNWELIVVKRYVALDDLMTIYLRFIVKSISLYIAQNHISQRHNVGL